MTQASAARRTSASALLDSPLQLMNTFIVPKSYEKSCS